MALRNIDKCALPATRPAIHSPTSIQQRCSPHSDQPQISPSSTKTSPLRSVPLTGSPPIGSYFPPANTLTNTRGNLKGTTSCSGSISSSPHITPLTTSLGQSNSPVTSPLGRPHSPQSPSLTSSGHRMENITKDKTKSKHQLAFSLRMFEADRRPSSQLFLSSNESRNCIPISKYSCHSDRSKSSTSNTDSYSTSSRTYHSHLAAQQLAFQSQQLELIQQTNRSTGLGSRPISPKLLPLGSPGPVTPLALEESQSGYVFAGGMSSPKLHLKKYLDKMSKLSKIEGDESVGSSEI